jgi:hypothetical protein
MDLEKNQSEKGSSFLQNTKGILKEPFTNKLFTKVSILQDTILLVTLAVLLVIYKLIAERLIENLVGNQTSQQILNKLLTESPELAQQFLLKIQVLIVYSVAAAILILIFASFLYILTRENLWATLLGKNNHNISIKQYLSSLINFKQSWKTIKQHYFRWVLVGALTSIVFILAAAVLLLLRYLLALIMNQITQNVYHSQTLIQVFNPLAIIVLLVILFSIEREFIKLRKVWQSVGEALSNLAKNYKQLIIVTVTYFVAILLVYFVIIRAIYQEIFDQTTKVIIDLIFFIILFSLLRISTNKALEE